MSPIVELADDGDVFGVGRPHREAHAGSAARFGEVRAERAVGFVERALVVQVEIGIGDLRTETVGVLDGDLAAVPEFGADEIAVRLAVEDGAEEAFRVEARHVAALGTGFDRGRFGLGEKRAHFPARLPGLLPDAMRTEDAERIAVVATHYCFNFFSSHLRVSVAGGKIPENSPAGRIA